MWDEKVQWVFRDYWYIVSKLTGQKTQDDFLRVQVKNAGVAGYAEAF